MRNSALGLVLAALSGAALLLACNTADLKQSGAGTTPGNGYEPSEDPSGDGGVAVDGSRDPNPDGGATIPSSTNVTIQVLPSDSGAAILNAIKGATKSVHMTMYLLTNDSVMNALIALKNGGVDVKVLLNQTFPTNGGSNTTAYNKLKNAGVDVRWASSAFQFTHAKSVIIDGTKVLVMTMNLTDSSPRDNREFIATDGDPQDVKDAETVFDADFNDRAVSVNGKLIWSPQSTSSVDARTRLKSLIDSAKTSLDVEVQSLSETGLTDAIILAKQANVKVRVVTAGGNETTPAEAASIARLKKAGVAMVEVDKPYIHAKAIVVDGTKAFVGSQNFTATALFNNREVGLVTDAPAEVAKLSAVIGQDFAIGTPPP